jgi:hypothetical protein
MVLAWIAATAYLRTRCFSKAKPLQNACYYAEPEKPKDYAVKRFFLEYPAMLRRHVALGQNKKKKKVD